MCLLCGVGWLASAQEITLCSKYTTAVFGSNTADDQLGLVTEVVNLAVLGNETLSVPGILAPEGGLAGFFSGAAGPTTNRGGSPVTINFLDGGANQILLLSHLYQFFGALLGCDAPGFPIYTGDPDMYRVHRFMELTKEQNDFFITQVGLSAIALGVTESDAGLVGQVLDGLFNKRCTPPLTADDGVPGFLVGTDPSICVDEATCPVADPSFCDVSPTTAPTMNQGDGTSTSFEVSFAFVALLVLTISASLAII